jgi:phage terminase large subunit
LETDTKQVRFPPKLSFLFDPHRYKVAHGGRGSGKSWGFAMALLILGAQTRCRILCTREIQKSIKDSVKKLLDDKIEEMGLSHFYDSLETEIRGRNGTEIIFAGLAQHTVESVKSYEGVDICWIEEAQTISKKSLDILIPTIRKPDSEIWLSFNPMLDTDEVWKRFVENTPPNTKVVQMNYADNPWFPEVLEQERLHCKDTSPEDYDNIWEGRCRSAVAGAIYSNEVATAIADGRVTVVPYNPRNKVHAIWDMGWNDSMSIILVQKAGPSALAIVGYIEDSFKTLDHYAALLNGMPYNWGYDYLPHDGFSGDYKTGQTAAAILQKMKRRVKQTPNMPVESGIKMARMAFGRMWFDKVKAARLIECLKRYRRSISQATNEPGAPVHDEYSHGADAFRYLGVVAEQLSNDEVGQVRPPVQQYQPNVSGIGL